MTDLMNKLPNVKRLVLALLLAGTLSACERILDQQPLADPVAETFYTNEAEATLAVNAIYDVLNGSLYYGNTPVALAMMEDHIYKGTNPNDGFGLSQINSLDIEPTNPYVFEWYQSLYQGINRANVAIERIQTLPSPGKISDPAKKRLVAEARFLRGLYYFYLVRLFGDVPLVLQTSADPSAPGVAKSPESAVYAQVETDFRAAIPDLPAAYNSANLGRATSGAAKSFLAQVHMWRNEAQKAIPLLEEVINSKQYALEPKFIDLFLEPNVNSKEMVFAIQYKDLGSNAESASWVRSIGVRGQRPVVNQSGFGFMVGTKELLDNYAAGDLRRDLSFWEFGEPNPATPAGAKYNAKSSSPFHLNTTDVGPQKWWWARQGYFQETATNLALIRYADVLLLYAEALNEANNGPTKAALDAINAVRARAGVQPLAAGLTKKDFFEAVLRERRAEFVFEFQRWWDLARTKTAERFFANAVYKIGKFNAKHYKWPLPQNALDRNKALVQNPNY